MKRILNVAYIPVLNKCINRCLCLGAATIRKFCYANWHSRIWNI